VTVGDLTDGRTLVGGEHGTGRVLIVRHEVDEPWLCTPHRRGEQVDVQRSGGHTHHPASGVAHGLHGVEVGGGLHHGAVAGAQVGVREQGDRLLRAGGDQDLVGSGRHTAFSVARGDGLAQRREAVRLVAARVQVGGQPFQRAGEGLVQLGRGGRRRLPEVQVSGSGQADRPHGAPQGLAGHRGVAAGRPAWNRPGGALRQRGDGARTDTARREPELAQPRVRTGRRGARDAENRRELTLARQAGVRGQRSGQDRRP
jgi:hypothetical protein